MCVCVCNGKHSSDKSICENTRRPETNQDDNETNMWMESQNKPVCEEKTINNTRTKSVPFVHHRTHVVIFYFASVLCWSWQKTSSTDRSSDIRDTDSDSEPHLPMYLTGGKFHLRSRNRAVEKQQSNRKLKLTPVHATVPSCETIAKSITPPLPSMHNKCAYRKTKWRHTWYLSKPRKQVLFDLFNIH